MKLKRVIDTSKTRYWLNTSNLSAFMKNKHLKNTKSLGQKNKAFIKSNIKCSQFITCRRDTPPLPLHLPR